MLAFSPFVLYSQDSYKINIEFKNLKNDTVLLGHYLANLNIPDDTVVTNGKGQATFKGNKKLPGGMFFLYFPGKKKLDFILDKDQEFIIEGDTSDLIRSVKTTGSAENKIFFEYQKFRTKIIKESEKLQTEKKNSNKNEKQNKEIDEKLVKLNKELLSYFEKTIDSYPEIFFTKFLTATKNVQVPKEIKGQKERYYYYRNHYFDLFDISDPRMLRTPIYEGKIETYLDKVLIQHPDTLIKEIDKFIEKAKTNTELYRYMLVHLYIKYRNSKMMTSENIWVHIIKKHYLNELNTWSSDKSKKDMQKEAYKTSNCLIGNKAQDIKLQILPDDSVKINNFIKLIPDFEKKGTNIDGTNSNKKIKEQEKVQVLSNFHSNFTESTDIYNHNNEYTILWFWTPDCSHCKTETPEFYKLYTEKKLKERGVKVLAIFINKGIEDWKKFSNVLDDWLKFVKKHELFEWTNAWNPFDKYRINYNISGSPVLYILDKDKTIKYKKIDYKQAIEVIEKELESKNKNN